MQIEDLVVETIEAISCVMRQAVREHRQKAEAGTDLCALTLTQLHYLHAVRELGRPTFRDLVEKFQVADCKMKLNT